MDATELSGKEIQKDDYEVKETKTETETALGNGGGVYGNIN